MASAVGPLGCLCGERPHGRREGADQREQSRLCHYHALVFSTQTCFDFTATGIGAAFLGSLDAGTECRGLGGAHQEGTLRLPPWLPDEKRRVSPGEGRFYLGAW